MWYSKTTPVVALAPMDGYTDQAFRLLVRDLDSRVVTFTEFLSADGIKYGAKPIMKALELKKEESPLVVQIFGKHPEVLAEAAQLVEQRGADGVDVNMGCPAKKIVNSMHGSALMKDIDLACRIVEAMKKRVSIPVSVKTRLGWSDPSELIPFIQKLESAGLDLITIHGRTYSQAFTGEADWDPIYELKRNVNIPVLGNGDVKSLATAKEKLGNLDGVMVGRATFGNPWLMKEIAMGLIDGVDWDSRALSFEEKLPVIKRHTQHAYDSKGYRGMLEMRKHLANYVKGVRGAADFRSRLVQVESVEESCGILDEVLEASKLPV